MKRININEIQYRKLLNEFHHSYDNGLQDAAIEIANKACELYSNDYSGFRKLCSYYGVDGELSEIPFRYDVSNIVGEELVLTIFCWSLPHNLAFVPEWRKLYIGRGEIHDAIESGDMTKLVQQIYHELGHMINFVSAERNKPSYIPNSQSRRDFSTPLFLRMDDEMYRKMSRLVYKFLSGELKARCFETTMFLKMNRGRNITLQDVYNDRCSGITDMRKFMNILEKVYEGGEENDKYNIINSFYDECIRKKGNGKMNASWDNKWRKLNMFFSGKLDWLKSRVDKIYYDFIQNNQENKVIYIESEED